MRQRITFGASLVALTIALTACGSSAPASVASSRVTASPRRSQSSYSACLSSHGFVLPKYDATSKTPPTTVSQRVKQEAVSACSPFKASTNTSERQKAFTAYLNCLTAHGVTVPSSPSSQIHGVLKSLRKSPAFPAAAKTCISLKPGRGGATTTTGPS